MSTIKPSVSSDEPISAEQTTGAINDALEVLLDAIQPGSVLESNVGFLKRRIGSAGLAELPPLIYAAADVIAESRYLFEQERVQMAGYLSDVKAQLEDLDRAVQNTEQQTQASFQGTQKVGATLDQQVHDITYRIRRAGNADSLKSWLNERLNIVQARLDEYQEQGGQSSAALHAQLQTLAGTIDSIGKQSDEFSHSINSERLDGDHDSLTEVGNRVQMETMVRHELDTRADSVKGKGKREREAVKPFGYQLWDIDDLTGINSTYGRAAGDKTLALVARLLKRELRGDDQIFRYGGDRFAIVLPETSLEENEIVAKRLHSVIQKAAFRSGNVAVSITVSGGYTASDIDDTPQSLHARADNAMHNAKRYGGDQYVVNKI